ncbi:unnamed protein product [Strongylus vulgaris]|uniref:Neurotransmitter-gated ion-channel transmembrane domain-containing protein n=1 Tax=Strongylus vulgaris TaxID=40348 RepID=A0A3P7J0B0_STRVU|nr:unnamed protein product [Strongylus vulgaris]
MAVLSLVVSEKVPHSSTHVPLLVAYFLFNMVSVSVAAMTTGIVMKVHRMGRHGREPEEWLLRLFCLRPMRVRSGIYTVSAGESPFHSSSYLKGLNGELRKYESQPTSDKIPVLESYVKKLAHTCKNIQVSFPKQTFFYYPLGYWEKRCPNNRTKLNIQQILLCLVESWRRFANCYP